MALTKRCMGIAGLILIETSQSVLMTGTIGGVTVTGKRRERNTFETSGGTGEHHIKNPTGFENPAGFMFGELSAHGPCPD